MFVNLNLLAQEQPLGVAQRSVVMLHYTVLTSDSLKLVTDLVLE